MITQMKIGTDDDEKLKSRIISLVLSSVVEGKKMELKKLIQLNSDFLGTCTIGFFLF